MVNIDNEVIGNYSRKDYIKHAIKEEKCLVVKENNFIVGFLIFHTNFFEHAFISLLIVSPKERRKGHATSLIQYFISILPTYKIFSSTNQSNIRMQKVFSANGFIRSGIIENLDDGDPEIIYFITK
ncbi:GNAT family N-acetyltransferase [Psychrobacillus sp. NPDC096389]|uniref:GNAT family N-acetyltransferase n=1 Tax=Psychrobacillus sp. NPDC096389 TaxID=3364490 RepID=UPI003806150B